MKTCPQCAEKVRDDALVCRHCGHRFTAADLVAGRREILARQVLYSIIAFVLIAASLQWLASGGLEGMAEWAGRHSTPDGGKHAPP